MLILLPLLTAGAQATTTPVHLDTNDELATALVAQVRADVKAGWTIVNAYGFDAGISAVKDGVVMRRSIEVDQDGDGGKLAVTVTPDTDQPKGDEFLTQSIMNGGVTLESGCGDWYLQPFVIENRARGEAAGTLVADTLRTADDLERADHAGGVVTMTLDRAGKGFELVVELGDDNRIDRATLKRVQFVTDSGRYQRKNRLRQALRGKSVTTIDTSGTESEVTLVVGSKRFAIDPDGDAFKAHPRDPDDSGCGC